MRGSRDGANALFTEPYQAIAQVHHIFMQITQLSSLPVTASLKWRQPLTTRPQQQQSMPGKLQEHDVADPRQDLEHDFEASYVKTAEADLSRGNLKAALCVAAAVHRD